MSLNAKQDDWSNLLSIESIDQPPPPDSIFSLLNAEDRLELAAVWVSDGIHARHTDYPKTSKEVQYFKMSRSAYLRGIFNIAVIIQLLATFLDNTKCDHDYSNDGNRLFNPNGSPTRLTLTILDLVCLVVYLYELFLVFIVNPSRKSLTSKPWSTLRLLICVFVLLDCLIYFIDPTQPRLMRCVFPFLLISKRNNLKLMCQGLIISAYKSLPIIKALVSILILWGFIGYFFFNATDGNTTAFSNPGEGIAEALHCFTSRPYVMKSLDSIYSSNQASAMYFVSLTIAADILCIALIVATGAKHYKQFAGNILHNRLVDRRHAITCAFYAIADRGKVHNSETDEEPGLEMTVSRQIWVNLCSRMVGKYAPSTQTANFIYDLVINGDPRRDTEMLNEEGEEEEYNSSNSDVFPRKFAHNIDLYLFFRCCALVAARIVVQVEAPVQNPVELVVGRSNSLSQRLDSIHKSVGLESECMNSNSRISSPSSDMLTVYSPCIITNTTDVGNGSSTAAAAAAVLEETKTTTPAVAFEQHSQDPCFDITMVSVDAHLDDSERTSTFKVLRVSEHPPTTPENPISSAHSSRSSFPVPPANSIDSTPSSRPSFINRGPTLVRRLNDLADRVHAYMLPIREACIHITGANVTVGGSGFVYTINVFHSINIFLILLLVIDLSYLSRPKKTLGWFAFVCILEACFWLHLFVRIAAVGVRRFVTFYENRADSLMNLCSLIALIQLGKKYTTDHYHYEGNIALGWFLLIQALRLFKLFFAINDVRVFEHMRPVLIRASFIYFSIIYFFAIFGYSYFCHAMNVQDALHTSPNNDANQWVQYSNLLNFNTLLQSVFTLFELSILGNWSIVMDAAVASTNKPAGAYIFFYTFRLVITLFILPILLSFIIQVFLSALNAKERDLKAQQEEEETTRFSLGQMGIFTQNPYTDDTTTAVDDRGSSSSAITNPVRGSTVSLRRSSTKVSYNVNQEVITVPRRRTTSFPVKRTEGDGCESEQDSEYEETFSPIGSPTTMSVNGGSTAGSVRGSEHSDSTNSASATGGGRKKRGSILERSGRNAWSIRLGVDKAKASNARDKFTESVTGVATGQPGQSYARPSEVSSVGYGSTGSTSASVEHTAPDGMLLSALTTPARGRPVSGYHSSVSSSRDGSGPNSRDRSPMRAADKASSSKVTVQYDSKGASSMMSIWTIDGNDTPNSQNSARKGGGGVWGRSSGLPPSGSTHTAGSSGSGHSNSHSNSAASAELAHLRGCLEAALRQLEAEKNKNQNLREQAHLI